MTLESKAKNVLNYPGWDGDASTLRDNGPEFFFYVSAESKKPQKARFELDYDKKLWGIEGAYVLEGMEFKKIPNGGSFDYFFNGSAKIRYSMRFYGTREKYNLKVVASSGLERREVSITGHGEGYPSSGTACFVLWSGDSSGPSIYETPNIDALNNAGISVMHKFTSPPCPYDQTHVGNRTADFSNYTFWAHSRMAVLTLDTISYRPINELDAARRYYVDSLGTSEFVIGADVAALATLGYATSYSGACYGPGNQNNYTVVMNTTNFMFPSPDYTYGQTVTVNTAPNASRILCAVPSTTFISQLMSFADDAIGGIDGYITAGNYTNSCSGKMDFASFTYIASITNASWGEDNAQEAINRTVAHLDQIPRINITLQTAPLSAIGDQNYTISVKANNTGKANASFAWINVTLPVGWTIINGSANVSTTNLRNGSVFWNNLTVKAGGSTGQQRIQYASGGCGIFANKSSLVNVTVFGTPEFFGGSPNFRILVNQTFNLSINITSLTGDLINLNVSLAIADQGPLNLTPGENFTKSTLYNISNGTTMEFRWSAQSKSEGLTKITVAARPSNGSNAEGTIVFSVIEPTITLNQSAINITNVSVARALVVGNLSPISYVNFTFTKPFTGFTERVSSTLISVVNESQCISSTSTGNAALLSSNGTAHCSDAADCNNTIDNSTSTSWTAVSGSWLNITFADVFVIDKLELVWRDLGTEANVSVFYNSTDWAKTSPAIQYVNPPNTTNTTAYTGFTPFQTNRLLINSSAGTAIIYEIRAYVAEQRSDKCYIFEANYSNTSLSGSYRTEGNITMSSQNGYVKQNSTFSVNYGVPQITINAISAMQISSQRSYRATVAAVGGDLRNYSINLTSSNYSVVNISAGSTPTNMSEILYGSSSQANWTVNATGSGSSLTMVTANSTTLSGTSSEAQLNITTFSDPGTLPNVTNFSFYYLSVPTNKTNLATAFVIEANVSDDVALDSVKVNISYPSFGATNGSMTRIEQGQWELWRFTFGTPPINESGNFMVSIIAVDIGLQEKRSGFDYPSAFRGFYANSTYDVVASSYATYNRGHSVSSSAYDVNGNKESSLSWTVNVTEYNGTENTTYSGTNDTSNYMIQSSDPEGNFTASFTASKNGNAGTYAKHFNVTRNLSIGVFAPAPGSSYNAQSRIDNPSVGIGNVRGSAVTDASVGIECLNQSLSTALFPLPYQSCFVGTYSFACNAQQCYSPSASGTQFSVTINATDGFNNSGLATISLSTTTQSSPESPGGGGGGGGGTPSGAAPSVAPSRGEKKDLDYNVTVTKDVFVRQGETTSFIMGFGSRSAVSINLAVSSNCCNTSFPKIVAIGESESKDEKIFVRAPLYVIPGEYFIDLSFFAPGFPRKSAAIKVTVEKRAEISSLEALEAEIPPMKSLLSEYEAAGIDVSLMRSNLASLEKKLSEARSFISSDQLNSLSQSIEEMRSIKSSIESDVERKRLLKFASENRERIASGIAVFVGIVYLMTQIFLPYRRLAKRLSEMRKAEIVSVESRKKTEKQYFRREIDENTFREIMIHEQEKILNTRAEIKSVSLEMRDLVKKKLNPLELVKWIATRPIALAGWISSLFRRGKKDADKKAAQKHEPQKPKKGIFDVFKRTSPSEAMKQRDEKRGFDTPEKPDSPKTLTLLEILMKAKELNGKEVIIEECTIVDNGDGKYILKDLSGTLEGASRPGMAGKGAIKGKVCIIRGKPRIEF